MLYVEFQKGSKAKTFFFSPIKAMYKMCFQQALYSTQNTNRIFGLHIGGLKWLQSIHASR